MYCVLRKEMIMMIIVILLLMIMMTPMIIKMLLLLMMMVDFRAAGFHREKLAYLNLLSATLLVAVFFCKEHGLSATSFNAS